MIITLQFHLEFIKSNLFQDHLNTLKMILIKACDISNECRPIMVFFIMVFLIMVFFIMVFFIIVFFMVFFIMFFLQWCSFCFLFFMVFF